MPFPTLAQCQEFTRRTATQISNEYQDFSVRWRMEFARFELLSGRKPTMAVLSEKDYLVLTAHWCGAVEFRFASTDRPGQYFQNVRLFITPVPGLLIFGCDPGDI